MEEIITERDVLIEILQLFKDFPCLWDTSHELYCNRDARKQAYTIIKECYSKFEKDATVEDVKKKLENMRAACRREKKKVENSKLSGAGIADMHTPSLWYYHYFTFLNEKPKPGSIGVDNINDDEGSDSDRKAPEKKKARDLYTRKESELIEKQMSLIDATRNLITGPREQNSADAFGQSVSSQLKELPNSQRWLAEKFIGDILYYAKTGELNRNSAINLNSQIYQHQPQSHSQMRFSSSHYRTQWSNSSSPNLFSHSPQYQLQPSHSSSPKHHIQPSHSPSPQHQIQPSQSQSPQQQIRSSHSTSPQHQIQSSHSPSPQHQVQSSHSPSPQHQIQSLRSPSPQHQIQSLRSPSSQHQIQSLRSPLPQHQIQSLYLSSPQHQVQSSHSPSPQHQIQPSLSPSPQHQNQSLRSSSPQMQSSHLLSQSPHNPHFLINEILSTQQQIRSPSLPQDQSLLLTNESDFSNESLDENMQNSVIRGQMKGLGNFLIFKKPQ